MAVIHVAIAGFSSKLAGLITAHLLQHPNIHIHGLCRDASKVLERTRNHPRVTLTVFDAFSESSVRAGVAGCNSAICCYGPMADIMLQGQKVLIDACIAEGVTRYIAGDFTWDFRNIPAGLVPPKEFAIDVAAYLEEKKDQIKAVHLLTGAFFEAVLSLPGFLWDWDEEKKEGTLKSWGSGDEVWDFSSYDDTARWTVEIALDEKAVGYIACVGEKITTREIAATFSDVYNRPLELELLGSLDEYKEKWQANMAKEPQNPWAWLIDMLHYHCLIGTGAMPTSLDNARFPAVKGTKLSEWLESRKIEDVNKSRNDLAQS